jgi:hypothetical protein
MKLPSGENRVAIPTNIDELCSSSYLYPIYLHILKREGYKAIMIDKAYQSKLKLDVKKENYLKCLSIPVATDKDQFPPLPSKKGLLRKGLLAAFNIAIEGRKIDKTLFKIKNITHPFIYLLGDMYGKAYQVEKTMLDKIIFTLRSMDDTQFRDVSSYVMPIGVIAKEKGLNVDLKSDLFDPSEKEYLKLCLQETKGERSLIPQPLKSLADISAFQDQIRNCQKTLAPFKKIINELVSRRLTVVFSPYRNDREKAKAKKTPVKELIQRVGGTKEFCIAFNPTLLFQLKNRPSLPYISLTKEEYDRGDLENHIKKSIDQFPDSEKSGAEILIQLWRNLEFDYARI